VHVLLSVLFLITSTFFVFLRIRPEKNSEFRISVAVLSFVFTFVLYFETIISKIARTIWLFFTLLYFTCFVLDANASITGAQTCNSAFDNTDLGNALIKAGASNISCTDMAPYAGLVVIDLIQVFTYYFIYECWGMTDDLYSDKGQSNHGSNTRSANIDLT